MEGGLENIEAVSLVAGGSNRFHINHISLGSFSTAGNPVQVCLLDVPSFMIPKEIISYFAPSLHEIGHFKIMKYLSSSERYLALLTMTDTAAANRLIQDYDGHPLSSLEGNITCSIRHVKEVIGHIAKDAADADCTIKSENVVEYTAAEAIV